MLDNQIDIIDEVQQNFVDASYDTNTNRAFPNVRDGLKPGQRACIWEMFVKGYSSKKPHVKSAKVDGGVAALWWPHGTTAIYETFARMSQPFTNNIPEVDFHGANGNIILGADALAADRYCMSGDTLIKTNKGTVELKSLAQFTDEEENLYGVDIYDYKYDMVPATKFFDCGEHETVKITMRNGLSATVTLNHPFLTVLNDGSFIWKKAEDLTEQDKLLIVSPEVDFSKEEIQKAEVFAKALGSLISEGYLTTQNRIGINNTDLDLIYPVKQWFEELDSNLTANISKRKEKDGCYEYCVASQKIWDYLHNELQYSRDAKDKSIPEIILSSSLKNKAAFFAYLFEGDGSVGDYNGTRRICYSTYSEKLAKQIQIVLAQDFGIFSNLYSSRRKTGIEYKVTITSYGLIRYNQFIGFISKRKRDILNEICLKTTKIANNSYYCWSEINTWIHSKIGHANQNMSNILNLHKAKSHLDNYNYTRIKSLYKNYMLIPIKEIQSNGLEKVYSVRVDNPDSDHSYIANGFINHNTEVRLAKITEEGMLQGINKKNVPMLKNFSEDEEWPQYLPAVFPRLLVNGAQGIGVGIANVWLPHSFTETANLILKYMETGELDSDNYFPDFPTGGTIVNSKEELIAINKTGKGKVVVDANYRIEGNEIIFYEMPYQVYIEPLLEKIKEKIEDGTLSGIFAVNNKSDKKRTALSVECIDDPEKIVEQLFMNTPLRSQYNANQNGIVSKTPIMLNLQKVVDIYIEHNSECIKKEYEFDIEKAKARIEILEGLVKALISIDEIVALIRGSKSAANAKSELMSKYSFSEVQAKAILDMKLAKLSNLESIEIENELQEKKQLLQECEEIVGSAEKQKEVLAKRLRELVKKYGDTRRTKIEQKKIVKPTAAKKAKEKVIEDVVITWNPNGYLQNIPLAAYKKNSYKAFKITTGDIILLFSNFGKYYRIAPKDVKSCAANEKGTAIGAILKLEKGEKIIYATSTIVNEKKPYIFFAAKNGLVKKVDKLDFTQSTRNLNGLVSMKLDDGNEVITIDETNGDTITLYTKDRYAIKFMADEVRATGKTAKGIKGINLSDNDEVVKCVINENNDLPIQKRNGKGKQYK